MSEFAIEFCKRDGCYKVAVGGNQATPNDLCRGHYLEEVTPQAWHCQVLTGRVTGLDGGTVTAGGTVLLHPDETNIPALVAGGLVEVATTPKPEPAAPPAITGAPAKTEKA